MVYMKPKVNEEIYIQSYKHDGSLHRTWAKGYVVESDEEKVVCITDKAQVIEADGRRWITREPAVYLLYYKEWFNVIAMMRKSGVFYYVNIATPVVFDEEALKNIDYDLDLKVSPDYGYQILDQEEYKYHRRKMGYSDEIDEILHHTLDKLIEKVKRKEDPFCEETINQYYQRYVQMKEDAE